MARRDRHRFNNRNSRRRGGRGNDRSLAKTVAMAVTVAGLPTAAIAAAGYFALEEFGKERLDKITYCYDRADQFQTAVFVDFSHTQSGSDSQGRDLENLIAREYRGLPPNGLLSGFTTARDITASIAEPSFVICHPAENEGEQQRLGAPEKSPTVLAREAKDAQAAFEGRLGQLMRDSKDPQKWASTSPILEQIQGITGYDFQAPLRKLVIYSDGINNSPNGRFCREKNELPSFEAFSQRAAYEFIKPLDLSGVDVEFYLVEFEPLPSPSLPHCTTEELRTFWIDYFKANGAKSIRLIPLGFGVI
ncbi:MAG: hypothetical protein AAGA97_00430 [Pseudomonadota bacterium]